MFMGRWPFVGHSTTIIWLNLSTLGHLVVHGDSQVQKGQHLLRLLLLGADVGFLERHKVAAAVAVGRTWQVKG